MMINKFAVFIFVLAGFAPASGVAAGASAAMSVSVTVLSSSCTAGASPASHAAALHGAPAAVTVACSLAMPYTVNVEAGTAVTDAGSAMIAPHAGQAGEGEAFTATITY